MTDELSERRRRDGRRKPSKLCRGHSRQTGKPCQQPPAPGSDFCRYHTGHTRNGYTNAARNALEARVRRVIPPESEWRRLDPLEAADLYRAEADAWLEVIRRELGKLESFEVTSVLNLGDGKTIEKVGAELRAIVVAYTQALDRCFHMATTALKLNIAERYADQLDRQAELFARVLAEGMRLLAIDVPPERYAEVIPRAIETVQREAIGS